MKLRLDPTACQGYGVCFEQAPQLIELDEWGYARIVVDDIAPDQVDAANAAVRACPNQALRLEGGGR